MVTARPLLREFPCCRHAVAWCELVVFAVEDEEDQQTLDVLRSIPFSDAFEAIRATAQEVVVASWVTGKHREAEAEMMLPEFERYLRRRLGSVASGSATSFSGRPL